MCPYWIVDYTSGKDGGTIHPVIIGGRAFPTEPTAQAYIDGANLSARAEIIQLDTVNQAKATSKIKAILIRRYKSLDKGLARAYHPRPTSSITSIDNPHDASVGQR
jgi:hypothetical protein